MALGTERPASGCDGRGPSHSVHLGGERRINTATLWFRIEPDGKPLVATGRIAPTLTLLRRAGEAGITSGEASVYHWARRTSDYVFRLRAMGVDIDMKLEPAGDAFVGRYTLRSRVTILQAKGDASC